MLVRKRGNFFGYQGKYKKKHASNKQPLCDSHEFKKRNVVVPFNINPDTHLYPLPSKKDQTLENKPEKSVQMEG